MIDLKKLLMGKENIVLTPNELKLLIKKMLSMGFNLSNSGDNGEYTTDKNSFQIYNDQYNEMFEPNRIKLFLAITNKVRQNNEFHKNNITIKISKDLNFLNLEDNKWYQNFKSFESELYYIIEELDYDKVTEYLNKLK